MTKSVTVWGAEGLEIKLESEGDEPLLNRAAPKVENEIRAFLESDAFELEPGPCNTKRGGERHEWACPEDGMIVEFRLVAMGQPSKVDEYFDALRDVVSDAVDQYFDREPPKDEA